MIWHILRKDFRILWRVVVAVAIANAAGRLMPFLSLTLGDGRLSANGTVALLGFVATGILIGLVVQLDTLPGPTSDWLTRPISRRDLLLSKLSFVVLLVQLPIFFSEIAAGLMNGMPVGPCVAAAASSSVWMLLALDLPMIAIAAVTRNMVACAGAAVAALLLFELFTGGWPGATVGSGIEWIPSTAGLISATGVVIAVLLLQYTRRNTIRSRWTLAAAMGALLLCEHMPWNAAFALQTRLSIETADAVQLAFAPARGREEVSLRVPGDFSPLISTQAVAIPVDTGGLKSGDLLITDRTELRVTDPSGAVIDVAPLPRHGRFSSEPQYLEFTLLAENYNRVKNQPMKITAEYWLTEAEPLREETLPLPGSHAWLPETGLCATRILSNGLIMCNCYPLVPMRDIVFAVDGTPQDNFVYDYAPYSTGGLSRDNRVGASIFAGNPGRVQQLMTGKYYARAYRPIAHLSRRVEISAIRLRDWSAGCFGLSTHCDVSDVPR